MGMSNSTTVSGLGMANGWLSLNIDRYISWSMNNFKIKLGLLNTKMPYVFLLFCLPKNVAVVWKYVFFYVEQYIQIFQILRKKFMFLFEPYIYSLQVFI